ncbi:MAG: hypothetical protein SPF57_10030 [Streptococcus orisratti]|uniref:hypothetical protein n=1 Tax=Streptococcus orisratti TaxID=114652 RepID=UPI002A90AB0D|nr:hypothetical protein [Streptococcus orisratti]MDY5636643.1 hypothetical protein [Streptococcus orisratti]
MKQSFITSYLTFYLHATVALEGNFIKVSNPNTILKVIPLGAQNKTIPVNQVSSVDDSFSLDLKSFIWGVIFAVVGLSMLSSSFIGGLILTAYGVLTVLSSFQTVLSLNLTSGGKHDISVVVFEKSNLLMCKETIEALIQKRYDDTNVAKHTATQTEALVDAIKSSK